MDRTAVSRGIAKQQYASARRSLTVFEERIVARYWDEDTLVRASFERFLGSLDRFAGWLLADDEISRRGQALIRRTGYPASAGEEEAHGKVAGDQPEQGDKQQGGPVDVTFTLPAEVHADSVALCGEFNQWSVEDIQLERGSDGTWRTTVALEPGRSYRYRYLLDGERWENAWHADRYVSNPYGSVDSVIIVEPHPEN
ncbi:MAG TPA: isoamylase early set domain-containing protein [Streptosporangiaceae bacterium]|jgi:hypothetical protein|nr:isoamylase early set domain-containing protein [Streptosporangiaceae bacterium]